MKFERFKKDTKMILIVSLIIVVITSSTVFIVLYSQNIKESKNIQVEFLPKSMKSCPEHTAWLLASMSYSRNSLETDFSFQIETNITIDFCYKLWNNSLYSHLIEIFVYPSSTHLYSDIEVKLTAVFGDIKESDTAIISVVDWTLDNSSYAETLLEPFISYLSLEKPEYDINETTSWDGISSGIEILIVEHFLFKSEFWEIEVSWHVMIAPHDWVSIYLRRRNETSPIWSGKTESWSSGDYAIVDIESPEEVYR